MHLQDWLMHARQTISPLDARLLAQFGLNLTPEDMLRQTPNLVLNATQLATLNNLLATRQANQPMAQILGGREFFGRWFKVTSHTLTPRPDSEILVEQALKLKPQPQTILDLGTGTGCLIITLLAQWPHACGVAVDICPQALAVAAQNADNLNVANRLQLRQGNWADHVVGAFDLIVSNPPYITQTAMATLDPDVANYEPFKALCGGPDGLDAYRYILPQAKKLLAPGGTLLFEIGFDQGQKIAALGLKFGFKTAIIADLSGHDRVVKFN
jgi:release factor glutamine methyltransferase